jgi:hypothetical protein
MNFWVTMSLAFRILVFSSAVRKPKSVSWWNTEAKAETSLVDCMIYVSNLVLEET